MSSVHAASSTTLRSFSVALSSGRPILRANVDAAAVAKSPTNAEVQKMRPAVIGPRISLCPTAARPIEAIQPHCEQSGFPPNWQGSTFLCKSADKASVVLAKMHCAGELGGERNSLISA